MTPMTVQDIDRKIEETAARAVDRGMAFLDAHVPGWIDKISLSILDVEHGTRCPLGQATGSFSESIVKWRLQDDAYAMGFACFWPSADSRRALNRFWIEAISARRRQQLREQVAPEQELVAV